QKSRAQPALLRRRLLRALRGDVGEVRVDHLIDVESEVTRVRADESAGEDRGGELVDVARLERRQEAHGDFGRCRNFLERDIPYEPLPTEFFSEREGRCLTHSPAPAVGGLSS